jgi:hypothetical protein
MPHGLEWKEGESANPPARVGGPPYRLEYYKDESASFPVYRWIMEELTEVQQDALRAALGEYLQRLGLASVRRRSAGSSAAACSSFGSTKTPSRSSDGGGSLSRKERRRRSFFVSFATPTATASSSCSAATIRALTPRTASRKNRSSWHVSVYATGRSSRSDKSKQEAGARDL